MERMLNEHWSCRKAVKGFEINDQTHFGWERIYLKEDPEGSAVERRGRGSKGRPRKIPAKRAEDLPGEVQRLRAENAYLKNLQALVLEKERRQRKKRR